MTTHNHDEIAAELTALLAARYMFAVDPRSPVHEQVAALVHDHLAERLVENIRDRMICCPASYLPGDPEPETHKRCHYAAMAIRVIEEGPEHV